MVDKGPHKDRNVCVDLVVSCPVEFLPLLHISNCILRFSASCCS